MEAQSCRGGADRKFPRVAPERVAAAMVAADAGRGFGAALVIDEAIVVVYLRGAVGLLPAAGSSEEVLARLPDLFSQAEVAREASTILSWWLYHCLPPRRCLSGG